MEQKKKLSELCYPVAKLLLERQNGSIFTSMWPAYRLSGEPITILSMGSHSSDGVSQKTLIYIF